MNREKKKANNDNGYQKTWKKEFSERMEKGIKFLQENFPAIHSVNRPKSTAVDIKFKEKTILTLSWKDGRLNQPKIFLVNPSISLRKKHDNITNKLVDKGENTFEYLIEAIQDFAKIHCLLLDFIKEKVW